MKDEFHRAPSLCRGSCQQRKEKRKAKELQWIQKVAQKNEFTTTSTISDSCDVHVYALNAPAKGPIINNILEQLLTLCIMPEDSRLEAKSQRIHS
jgi:hypothetical protein